MGYREWADATGFEAKAGFALAPIQIQDVEQFLEWEKSLNTYEVGGGKTVVSTVVSLMAESQVTLVIMPPILLAGWEKWLRRVSDNILRYQGPPKVREVMSLRGPRWVLMSHHIFRGDFERIKEETRGLRLELIVDEAQAIKSCKSKLYKMVGGLTFKRRVQLLTGTPTSKPEDAYSYIKLKSPDMYRSYAHFEHLHVAEKDFFGAIKSYQNLDILAENFNAQRIKRSKQDIHGYDNAPSFPETSYELEPAHIKLYEKLLEEQLLLLDDGSKIDATTATRMYHAMQQIVVNYDVFAGDPTKRSAAYDLIDEVIEETNCLSPVSYNVDGTVDKVNSKLIIWTYYKMTSAAVTKYLLDKKYKVVAAYGDVDSAKSFERFMDDPETRIGVFQYQSAGSGLNPQLVCWESLHLETPTSPMLVTQSIGRLDRMGQQHKPTIRFAQALGTVQPTLLAKMLANDDLVAQVERTKETLRKALTGGL